MEETGLLGLNHISYEIYGALIVGSIAVIWDLKYRKIPNWLTFPSIVLGIIVHLTFNLKNWPFPFLGLLVGLLALFIPFSLGGIGAGDVKLLMALGAFLGSKGIFWTAVVGGVVGGIISLFKILSQTGLSNTKIRLFMLFSAIWNASDRKILQAQLHESNLYIPYGVAIYIGLIVTLIWRP